MVSAMPMLKHSITVPRSGFVDIHVAGMRFRFDEQAIRRAIKNTKKGREHFATEEAYQDVLSLYEQALRLLENEKRQ
jgi:hypothetical protein